MGVQFGKWSFEGAPPAPDYIEKVVATLAPYGPDSNESYTKGGVKILYRAFHTTKESRRETQPHICPSGTVITWDGRLDNRAELISELRDFLTISRTDVAIVAAAYEKWGSKCFAKFIGDWALSIWNPISCSLILAKDFIGTRHLYYSIDKNQVTWSSILDPLVQFAEKTFPISEEYIAGWFSYFPAAHLTPYVGIHAVPPSSFVVLGPGKHRVSKYWDFDPAKKIRYRTDAEYEEHFRTVFAKAVQRRLRSDRPALAELSGGLDSSSIVCTADRVLASCNAECPRLDTISWFDDTNDHIEPDTNELHWITKVEERRGRTGYHIDCGAISAKEAYTREKLISEGESDQFLSIPDSRSHDSAFVKQYAACLGSEHRVTLSGIGGSEFMGGGVPTPLPELRNFLSRARFLILARRLKAWSRTMQTKRFRLLWESIRGFLPTNLVGLSDDSQSIPWLDLGFIHRNYAALRGCAARTKLFGPLPSFQECVSTFNAVRRLLAYCRLRPELLCDARYPFLDLELLEFLFAIPREQIVGVGRRRSLMRRALSGIIPEELLNRRRRVFVPPELYTRNAIAVANGLEERHSLLSNSIGVVDSSQLREALRKLRSGEKVYLGALRKTLTLELWLRQPEMRGLLKKNLSLPPTIPVCVNPVESRDPSSALADSGVPAPLTRHENLAGQLSTLDH